MTKTYDLEERTFLFAKEIRLFFKNSYKPMSIHQDDIKQVVRSSGSVAANYIEANESLSKKDFNFRIKICRKEAKESTLWLRLIKDTSDQFNEEKLERFIQETMELRKIFTAILKKS